MDFTICQIGQRPTISIDKAVAMINRSQTLWRLKWYATQIKKPGSYNLLENLEAVPVGQTQGISKSSFFIGVTSGRVGVNSKLSIVDTKSRALISEFDLIWRGSNEPAEVFWALAIANICFQSSINSSCTNNNCIGFNAFTIDDILLKMLNLEICSDCMRKVLAKYKYQVADLRNLLHIMRKPREYDTFPPSRIESLPVLEKQIQRQLNSGGTNIFKDYGIIIVMHFLPDLVPFVDGLIKLGAKQDAIGLVVKPYPYAQRALVNSIFYEQYPEILVRYLDKLPPSEDTLLELIGHCKQGTTGNILLIEDGGYVVPFLHKEYTKATDMCVGAVEQTTKGLRQDEEIKPEDFHFPLLDVAKSNFKDEYESPLVGRAAVSSIQRLLPDESLSGKIALVVGFGAIGREVALALSAIGMIVRVSDLDARKVAAARVRGFEAAISPMKFAGEAYIVIGTTGTQSVTSDMIDHMKNGTVIASTSSDQVEIDIEYLKQIAEERYEEGLGTHFSKKGERTECTLLLADGFPVNFFSGSGIPTKAIDPVLTQLFIGAIHLAKNHAKLQKGILTNKMDNLVDEYGLISDFLQTYVR